jgi:hypothetical protein
MKKRLDHECQNLASIFFVQDTVCSPSILSVFNVSRTRNFVVLNCSAWNSLPHDVKQLPSVKVKLRVKIIKFHKIFKETLHHNRNFSFWFSKNLDNRPIPVLTIFTSNNTDLKYVKAGDVNSLRTFRRSIWEIRRKEVAKKKFKVH